MSVIYRSVIAVLSVAALLGSTSARAELPIEPTPAVKSLPSDYPSSYVFVSDGNFFGLEAGKVVIIDVAAEFDQYKGSLSSAQFGFFGQSKTRPELYVVETFYARGQRGERTDVLTIYDKASLNVVGEVLLPGGKRAQTLPEQGAFQISNDDRYAYIFNFTPAASVTIVDLVARKIVGDVDIPGCIHAFAMKNGGFASLCGNGGVVSTKFDAAGKVVSQKMSQPFSDIDNEPMFTRPAIVDGVAYFPTYHGKIIPVDLNGEEAVAGEPWDIGASAAEAPKKKSWTDKIPGIGKKSASGKRLPSGWQLIASDDAGRLYVIMRATESIDDHDTGGDEVFVLDPKTKSVTRKIKLRQDSHAITLTSGPDPYLVALNPDMSVDVLRANSGEFVRRIGGGLAMTAFQLSAAE